jgi:hypothetical protein
MIKRVRLVDVIQTFSNKITSDASQSVQSFFNPDSSKCTFGINEYTILDQAL